MPLPQRTCYLKKKKKNFKKRRKTKYHPPPPEKAPPKPETNKEGKGKILEAQMKKKSNTNIKLASPVERQ